MHNFANEAIPSMYLKKNNCQGLGRAHINTYAHDS